MYQDMVEYEIKNPGVAPDPHHWNMNHAMYHLSLSQIYLSGSIGNLLRSKDPKDKAVARRLYKAVKEVNSIFEVGVPFMNYEKYNEDMEGIIDIINLSIDRRKELDVIMEFLMNDDNFETKLFSMPDLVANP